MSLNSQQAGFVGRVRGILEVNRWATIDEVYDKYSPQLKLILGWKHHPKRIELSNRSRKVWSLIIGQKYLSITIYLIPKVLTLASLSDYLNTSYRLFLMNCIYYLTFHNKKLDDDPNFESGPIGSRKFYIDTSNFNCISTIFQLNFLRISVYSHRYNWRYEKNFFIAFI